eukprot:scaffold10393_cov114-Isochrysis_galbana.AAC.5
MPVRGNLAGLMARAIQSAREDLDSATVSRTPSGFVSAGFADIDHAYGASGLVDSRPFHRSGGGDTRWTALCGGGRWHHRFLRVGVSFSIVREPEISASRGYE